MVFNKDCPFCDVSVLGDRFISLSDDFFAAATLGQITDGGYMLLVPKRHVSCIGSMEEDEVVAMNEWREILIRAIELAGYNSRRDSYIEFEHGTVGQTVPHAHLHILPTKIEGFKITKKIAEIDFPDDFLTVTLSLQELREQADFHGERYLYWKDGDERFVLWNPDAPKQYLRLVVAELLGRAERGNWRDMDPELDAMLYSQTAKRIKDCIPKAIAQIGLENRYNDHYSF